MGGTRVDEFERMAFKHVYSSYEKMIIVQFKLHETSILRAGALERPLKVG